MLKNFIKVVLVSVAVLSSFSATAASTDCVRANAMTSGSVMLRSLGNVFVSAFTKLKGVNGKSIKLAIDKIFLFILYKIGVSL